jgi:5,5'-dehydrodivanillate O-demethylase oxygenase subunit
MQTGDTSDFAHVGPETLAGRYLRRFWHPIARGADLVPGRPVRAAFANEHFTLYRGQSGAVVLLDDRCPHRQTSLAFGWVEDDCIRCLYHGWVFDPTGQCVEQPAENAAFAAKVKITAYPVREYFGLVYGYFGEGEPPEFPRYPEFEEATGADYSVNAHAVPCSWFQRLENDVDEVHVHFVHSVSTRAIGLKELPEITVTETDYGIRREGKRSGEGVNVPRVGHLMMPNINMTDLPPSPEMRYWTVHLAYRVPMTDDSSMTFSIRLKKPEPGSETNGNGNAGGAVKNRPDWGDPNEYVEKILAGKMRLQDMDPDYPALFVVEDNVALAGQGRITERHKDRLGQSDKGIILLRKIWERELRALAEGRPLKIWSRPKSRLDLAVSNIRETAEFV